jgi:hypothetical protein
MDDTFRLDLAGYDKKYVDGVLDGFLTGAPRHGRRLKEIRVSMRMFDRLGFEESVRGSFYKGVPVEIFITPFEDTIEAVVGWPQ